jgi:hypothetical protein
MSLDSTDLNWIADFIEGIADDVLRDLYVLASTAMSSSPKIRLSLGIRRASQPSARSPM